MPIEIHIELYIYIHNCTYRNSNRIILIYIYIYYTPYTIHDKFISQTQTLERCQNLFVCTAGPSLGSSEQSPFSQKDCSASGVPAGRIGRGDCHNTRNRQRMEALVDL